MIQTATGLFTIDLSKTNSVLINIFSLRNILNFEGIEYWKNIL
jgi:hypothetical protein